MSYFPAVEATPFSHAGVLFFLGSLAAAGGKVFGDSIFRGVRGWGRVESCHGRGGVLGAAVAVLGYVGLHFDVGLFEEFDESGKIRELVPVPDFFREAGSET